VEGLFAEIADNKKIEPLGKHPGNSMLLLGERDGPACVVQALDLNGQKVVQP
jgi:hypothetical protein